MVEYATKEKTKLQIYQIDYSFFVDMRNEEEKSILESKPRIQQVSMEIHFGADNIAEALEEAIEFLNKNLEEENFTIDSVTAMEGVDVVNWPGEDGECDCPFCRAERIPDEDTLKFECSCGSNIKVADDWDEIHCRNCHRTIYRDRVIGSNGNYTLIDIGGESNGRL